MTINYVRVHDEPVILEIEPRGPVYQIFTSEIFPDYKSDERKRHEGRIVGRWRCETRKQTARFKGQRGKG